MKRKISIKAFIYPCQYLRMNWSQDRSCGSLSFFINITGINVSDTASRFRLRKSPWQSSTLVSTQFVLFFSCENIDRLSKLLSQKFIHFFILSLNKLLPIFSHNARFIRRELVQVILTYFQPLSVRNRNGRYNLKP